MNLPSPSYEEHPPTTAASPRTYTTQRCMRCCLTFALCRAVEGAQRRGASVGHQRGVRWHSAHLLRSIDTNRPYATTPSANDNTVVTKRKHESPSPEHASPPTSPAGNGAMNSAASIGMTYLSSSFVRQLGQLNSTAVVHLDMAWPQLGQASAI